jgi:protein-export membrane protein SecD
MKRCPICSRVYDEGALRFCLDDGSNLIEMSPGEPVPPTLVMPASVEPIPTIKQAFQPVAAPINDDSRVGTTTAGKRNILLWLVIGSLIFLFGAGAVVGAFVMYARRAPLTWHLVLAVDPSTPDLAAATKQAADVIERRLDAFGVAKLQITPQSNGQILLDLPKVEDPERLKALISTGGKLELTHVISPGSPSPVQTYATNDEAVASLNSNGTIPSNRRVLPYTDREAGPGAANKWVVVELPAIVNGNELRDARSVPRQANGSDYQIAFSLNKTGAEKFGAWTGANINEYMGVVLNDEVKSVAYIKSQIYDQGVIDGRFTKQSAEDLALVLRAGALPAKILFQEERIDK